MFKTFFIYYTVIYIYCSWLCASKSLKYWLVQLRYSKRTSTKFKTICFSMAKCTWSRVCSFLGAKFWCQIVFLSQTHSLTFFACLSYIFQINVTGTYFINNKLFLYYICSCLTCHFKVV